MRAKIEGETFEFHFSFVFYLRNFQEIFYFEKEIEDLREICYSKVNVKQDGRISQ